MSATDKPVDLLARAIVNRLEDRGVVEFRDAEAGILVVAKLLQQNFEAVEAIELEAQRRTAGRPSAEREEERRRIAAERNVIL